MSSFIELTNVYKIYIGDDNVFWVTLLFPMNKMYIILVSATQSIWLLYEEWL